MKTEAFNQPIAEEQKRQIEIFFKDASSLDAKTDIFLGLIF